MKSLSKMVKFFPALVLAAALAVAQCRGDLIDDTCLKTPFPGTCLYAIRPDPRCRGADITTLGVIVVDKVAANSATAGRKIRKLLGSATDPKVKAALSKCGDSYHYISKTGVAVAKEALVKGNPKFAQESMIHVQSDAQECEAGFLGQSPLTDVNTTVEELGAVAAAIAGLLL